MMKVIIGELKKLFETKYIYLSVACIGIVLTLVGSEQIVGTRYPGTFVNNVAAALDAMLLVCFLFCIMGGGFGYCAEEKSGYMRYAVLRTGAGRYTLGKITVSALGGFITVFFGVTFASAALEVLIYQQTGSWTLPGRESFLKFSAETVMLCMLCGILSAVGFVVTTFLSNYYIGLTLPVIFYYVVLILNTSLPVPEMIKLDEVYFSIGVADKDYIHYLVYGTLYGLCFLTVLYYIAKNRINRRLEHA